MNDIPIIGQDKTREILGALEAVGGALVNLSYKCRNSPELRKETNISLQILNRIFPQEKLIQMNQNFENALQRVIEKPKAKGENDE